MFEYPMSVEKIRNDVKNGVRPLVSFSVVAYNQEKYIRDAVLGAFSQTYQPLEIILSDDCSRDRTYEIMQELAASYKGPHKIILNRNEKNLGVTNHFNRIAELEHGAFSTLTAGDDIPLPNKVQVMMDVWAKHNYCPMVCYTQMYWMEEDGTKTQKLVCSTPNQHKMGRDYLLRHYSVAMPGASAGLSSSIREIFGTIDRTHSSSEDNCNAMRGALANCFVYIDTPTMYWRKSGLWTGMVGKPEYAKKLWYDGLVKGTNNARQYLVDALKLKDAKLIRAMCAYWNECEFRRECVQAPLWKLPFLFVRAWRNGCKFIHLAHWVYSGLRYRWQFEWKDKLLRRKRVWGYMGDREIIYEKR